MNWDIWYGVEEILLDSSVCPILAVVPDNQDDALNVGAVNPKFWQEVHVWQARHWTIGLHGYQHHYTTRNSGLLGLSKLSEFAGLTAREQEERIGKAMGILEREEVAADIWVAPGHSFDATTLRILQSVRIDETKRWLFTLPVPRSRGHAVDSTTALALSKYALRVMDNMPAPQSMDPAGSLPLPDASNEIQARDHRLFLCDFALS